MQQARRTTALRSAVYASSVTLSADVGSRRQACSVVHIVLDQDTADSQKETAITVVIAKATYSHYQCHRLPGVMFFFIRICVVTCGYVLNFMKSEEQV